MTQLPPPSSAPAGWYCRSGRASRLALLRRARLGAATLFMPAPITFAPPAAPHPSLPLTAAVGALVILLASLVGGRLLIDVLTRFDWPLLVYVALLTAIAYGPSVVWCWYVSRRWGTGRLSADVGLRFRWSDAGWGPVIWIAALVVQIAVAALILAFDIPLTSNTERVSDIDADRALRDRAGDHGGRGRSDRRGDGVSRDRDARLASPARRGRDRRRAGGLLRGGPLRPGAGVRQHRPRDGAVGGRRGVRPRRLSAAPDRADDRRPRDLQRRRADHRAHAAPTRRPDFEFDDGRSYSTVVEWCRGDGVSGRRKADGHRSRYAGRSPTAVALTIASVHAAAKHRAAASRIRFRRDDRLSGPRYLTPRSVGQPSRSGGCADAGVDLVVAGRQGEDRVAVEQGV